MLATLALAGCDWLTDPEDSRVLWSVTQFGGTVGAVYADDDVVVAGVPPRRIIGVTPEDGAVLWQQYLTLPTNAYGDQLAPNLEVLRWGNYLIVSTYGLYALDRETGALVWSLLIPGDWPGRWMVLAGDRLIGTGRSVYSIDPTTGEVMWSVDLGELPSAPVYDDGVLYFGARAIREGTANTLGEGHAMAVDANTGEVLWQYFIPDHPTKSWNGGVVGRAVLTEELFLVASENSRVYALDRATGDLVWYFEGLGPLSRLVLVGDVVVAGGSSGDLHGIEIATGVERWSLDLGSSIHRMGVVPGVALIANGRVWAIDSQGQERWSFFGGTAWLPTVTVTTQPTVWNGVLYANSVERGLFAVEFPLD